MEHHKRFIFREIVYSVLWQWYITRLSAKLIMFLFRYKAHLGRIGDIFGKLMFRFIFHLFSFSRSKGLTILPNASRLTWVYICVVLGLL